MPPEFLNSREDAVLVVAVLVFAYAFRASAKSNGGLASSFAEVFKSLLHSKLLLLFGSAAAYSVSRMLKC